MVKKKDKHTPNSETLKKSLIKVRAVIRKKFQELHNQRLTLDRRINETFKPIIKPLNILAKGENKNVLQHPEKKREEEFEPSSVYKTANGKPKKSVQFFSPLEPDMPTMEGVDIMPEGESDSDSNTSLRGTTENILEKTIRPGTSKQQDERAESVNDDHYGFRSVNGKVYMGKHQVKIRNGYYIINDKGFAITPGLSDLLYREKPENYDSNDLEAYKQMLIHTSAHKTYHDRRGVVRRSPKSYKYKNIVKNLFPIGTSNSATGSAAKKSGGCIKKPQMNFKTTSKANKVNYTYWDDPNELVERLRLLIASQSAGHTGHDNEIISIIEELKEAGIIK